MDDATPAIRISLPQAWIDKRSLQVGSKEVALGAIKNLVYEVAPEATIEIVAVAGISPSPLLLETNESYAKQIVLMVGILAVLLSGFATDWKRRKEEVVVVRSAGMKYELSRLWFECRGTPKFQLFNCCRNRKLRIPKNEVSGRVNKATP